MFLIQQLELRHWSCI